MIVLKICGLLLWLLIVPFCVGLLLLPLLEKRLHTPGVTLICGYILLFALLEIVGIPVLLLAQYHGFTIFSGWYTAAIMLLASGGVLLILKRCRWKPATFFKQIKQYVRRSGLAWRQIEKKQKVLLFIFVILVGFQMFMAFTCASFDGDDAYYNVQALIAQQLDTLYRVNPYTGRSTPLDVRHGLALFPVWEAYAGSMSGIHAGAFCHSIAPLLLIPLTYTLYAQIGNTLLKKKRELLPVFMIFLAVWQMFGNISIYTPETFFLTRTWQGKSVAANFILPAIIWVFLVLFEKQEQSENQEENHQEESCGEGRQAGLWLILAALNLAAGASSSLALMLAALLTAGLAVLFTVRERRIGILIKAGFCCVPSGVYVLLYLLLAHGVLVI